MKSFIRRMAQVRHAVFAVVLQSVLIALIGTYFDLKNVPNRQGNPLLDPSVLIAGGATAAALSIGLLVVTYCVSPATESKSFTVNQPQLSDVHAHMHRTSELPQAS